MAETNSEQHVEEVDYYMLLGVSRDADAETIEKAFRKLAKAFHPDRFPEPEAHRAAQARFIELREAADVLLDANRRQIYDMYGVTGLKQNLEVGAHLKSPEEIMREFARMRRRQEEEYLEHQVAQRGVATAYIDATSLWEPEQPDQEKEVTVSSVIMRQSIQVPVGTSSMLHASGVLMSNGRNGNGTMKLNLEHSFSEHSKVWILSAFAPGQTTFGLKGHRKISTHSFGQLTMKFPIRDEPSLDITVGRIISQSGIVGSVSWRVAPSSSLHVDVNHAEESKTWHTRVAMGRNSVSLDGELSRSFNKHVAVSSNSSIWLNGSASGFLVDCTLSYRLSHLSKVGVGFALGTNGVTLALQYIRHGQTIAVPIRFASDLTIGSVLAGLFMPAALALLSKIFVLDPLKARKHQKKLERMRSEREEHIRLQKEKAESYRQLMEEKVAQKREEEEKKNGLVIVHATYGKVPEKDAPRSGSDEENPFSIDVTVPLQFLVENSQLHLHPHSKSGIVGFYDPCPGEDKCLQVIYLFRNKLHSCIIHDLEPLRIPLQSHLDTGLEADE